MFGRLTWHAFIHDFVQNAAVFSGVILGAIIFIALTYYKKWKWLWNEWITSQDPKRIGIMYLIVVFIMLFKGLVDAWMMRIQQYMAVGDSQGYLTADHFQQIFSAHGTTMIFFVGMGVVFGMMNLIVPLQIGARDVAFPFLNAVSFWLFAAGGMLLMISLGIGDFGIAGWLSYPPLSGLDYSPGEGIDYWIWIVQIAGIGSTLAGINFLVTILKMRCPGMTLFRMPMFCWASLASLSLIIFAFPVLTATLALLTLDRYLGMHFFTADFGGNYMMYINLIWAWGHPEVYILILPAFGIFSEVVATFSEKRLFGYMAMVWAIIAITILSFIVWLHHFFVMGASPVVNAVFGIATVAIAVPTGVKIFNWLFTIYRGRVHLATPMLWFLGFIVNFTIGGMTGVLLSIPPFDFQVHNSLFLVAHFHNVIIPGVLFGFFAGITYWFPKATGFMLNERLGRYAFWCWLIGFLLAFMPLYQLGFMGATRRLNHYDADTGWHFLFTIAFVGVTLITIGVGIQILQLFISILQRNKNRDDTGDPWNARTLEWMTTSPPFHYNFAVMPMVKDHDPFWAIKKGEIPRTIQKKYEGIEMPLNSQIPFYIGVLATAFGFGMIWHIWWMAAISFIFILVLLIIRFYDPHTEHIIPAEQVSREDKEAIELKTKYPGKYVGPAGELS